MNETPTKPRAKAGSGMLYLRGSTWWIKYHQDGTRAPASRTSARRARFCAIGS
jgi:hypothetical protein